MRHFAMNEVELIEFLSSLRLSRLTADGTYLVYNVPKNGELGAKSLHLKKGTLVFVDGAGTPVLLASCGNPMMRGPKKPFVANKIPEGLVAAVTGDLEPMPTEIAVLPQEELLVSVVQPDVPEVVPVPPPPPPPPTPPTQITTTGRSDIPVAGVLGILPALFFVGGGGGNPPIPEPATILILGIGAGAAICSRRKRG